MKVTDVPEVMSDVEVTRFKKSTADSVHGQSDADRVTSITTGGEEYDANKNAYYEDATLGDYYGDLLTNKTYDIYMDQYGYFIGAALHSGEDQYVFIAAYDTDVSAMGWVNAKALAIFPDGQMKQIEVNTKDTDAAIDAYNAKPTAAAGYGKWAGTTSTGINLWYTYSVDNDNVYTLAPPSNWTIETSTGKTIQTDNLALNPTAGTGRAFGNEDSIYITVEDNTPNAMNPSGYVIDEVTGLYTGVQSVKMTVAANDWIAAVYDKDNYIIAAVVLGEAEGAVDNYAYILSGANSEGRDSDGNYYWTFKAILNGEIQEMTIKSKYTSTVLALNPGVVQELVMDGENYVTSVRNIPDDATWVASATNNVYGNTELDHHVAVTGFDVYDVNCSVELSLEGRTLHIDPTYDHYGLFFASDAKAVVSQEVNGDRSEIEYSSVKEAYSTLSDSDGITTNGLTFNGRIVAVLDSNGVAQWVFFYDNHGVTSGDRPNYNNGATILNLAHDGTQFTATVASNANITGTTVQWEMEVYQGNVKVGDSGRVTGGNWTANTGYPLSAAGAVPFSGTYRVVVSIYKDGVLAASGENTFTVNP